MDLTERIETLEAESAIRRLKARYLNACDAKDVDAIRNCFTPDACIEYPPLGRFDVDGLIQIFTQLAASTAITDVHQGHNGEITINRETASARWNLGFVSLDPETNGMRLLSGFYHDEYRKTESGWKISYTRSEPRVVIDGKLEDGTVRANWIKDNS